ncbi:uncharacterized protein METZ01_LOCUS384059, partial [marine metagenome]
LGGSIPATSTPLKLADLAFTPNLSGGTLSLTDVVTSSTNAVTLTSTAGADVAFGNCPSDCADVCYGTAATDACGTCDTDTSNDVGDSDGDGVCDTTDPEPNCATDDTDNCGVCSGGNASMDDCGVCSGNGSTCVGSISLGAFDSSGSVEVLYNFGGGVAAFSFEISGLALTGASGGAAETAGMMMSAAGSKVVAFNMFNTEVPAGSGVLTNVSFSSVTDASSSLYLAFDDGFYGADEDALTVTASGSV